MLAYFDCFSGASGDMILGALLDAGLSFDDLIAALRTLPLPDWRLEQEQIVRGALGATLARVITAEVDPPNRSLGDVLEIVERARFPGQAAADVRAIFTRLAESEARVHRLQLDEVHFHEVGAADAILDICGAAVGLALLDVDTVYCSPLPLNRGFAGTLHGTIPLPAPATLELLARVSAPTVPFPTNLELLTPTGAAILTCLATFEQPAMHLHTVGYGAGSRAEPSPNLLRVLIGTSLAQPAGSGDAEEMLWMLECNLDDMNPQWFSHVFERLLDAGALDVTCAPVLMKKGRPGQLLSVLCGHDSVASATEILLTETTTLGVRRHAVARFAAERTMCSVATPFGEVPVKLRILHGLVTQATPEYEACRELALRLGVPLPLISQAAHAAAQPLLAQPPPRDSASSGK